MMWPSRVMDQPQWNMVDLQSYIDSGFNLNSVIYSAIMYKARAVASAPLMSYQGEMDEAEALDRSHPLAQVLVRPNPFQSAIEFQQINTVYFNLAGNAYIYFARERAGDVPYAMYTLRPDRVKIIPTKDAQKPVLGFVYVPEGLSLRDGYPMLPEDVMHVKLPNPGDPLNGAGYGLSPLAPLAQSANVDNDITRFLKVFFQKGAMFQHVITFDRPMGDKDMAAARDRFEQIYGGVENWAKAMVMDSGGKVSRVSPTFEEMGFETVDERNEARILGPFGVPPILIGTRLGLMRSTYSNYETARTAFWEDTLLPELRLFENEYQHFLGDDDLFVRYDVSSVPALRRDIVAQTGAALNLIQGGVPVRQALAAVGLEVEDFEGETAETDAPASTTTTDEIPVNVETTQGLNGIQVQSALLVLEQMRAGTLTSAAAIEFLVALGIERSSAAVITSGVPDTPAAESAEMEAEIEPPTPPTLPDVDQSGQKARKAYDPYAMQRKMDTLAVSNETRFGDRAAKVFDAEARELDAMIDEVQRESRRRKGSFQWRLLQGMIEDWYKTNQPEVWREAFVPLIEGVMIDAGQEWAAALGVQWNVRNIQGEAWFQNYTLKFAQPITDTSSAVVKDVIAQAMSEGWSIPQMQERLGLVFQQWAEGNLSPDDFEWMQARLPNYRREAIARTETIRASNAGTHELGKQWGVKFKGWLSSGNDGRTRDSHIEAGDTYGPGGEHIPLDDSFMVGGVAMLYPGDPSAPPDETVNCRCTQLLYTE